MGVSLDATIGPGASISNPLGERGTLGLKVIDFNGNPYGLTCAHVVAPPGISNPMNEVMDSPAQKRNNAGKSPLGTVWAWSAFDHNDFNRIDAALIVPALHTSLNNEPLRLGSAPSYVQDINVFLNSAPDGEVEIWRASTPANGQIDRVYTEADNKIFGFGADKLNVFWFTQILGYSADLAPGDSGAVVIHRASRNILGIHFASEPGMGYCILFESVVAGFPEFKLKIAA